MTLSAVMAAPSWLDDAKRSQVMFIDRDDILSVQGQTRPPI